MPDYNIYIHSAETTSNKPTSPTVAWKKEEQQNTQTSSWGNTAAQIGGFVANPDSLVQMGFSAVMKAIPYVVIAKLVIDTGIKVYETALDFITIRTGNYAESIKWNNIKSFVSGMMRPFSSAINEYKQNAYNSVENDRRIKQLELLGDSVINSYFNRGV